MNPLDLNPMAYVNTLLSMVVIIMGIWYAIYGRKIDRWMMLINVLAGFWVLCAYLAIFLDNFFIDFMSAQDVTAYAIRPALFVLLATKLANMIRIGRKE